MLEAQNVACVRGDRKLFNDINFTLTPGSLLQVTGPNGSGKTSLLRIICCLLTAEKGEIRWNGENVRTLGEEYAWNFSYIGHRHGLKEELTSFENLRVSSGLAGSQITASRAEEALTQVGLGGREHLPTRFLSEGQKRRSALARLVACGKTLWVLDEVFASLDTEAVGMIESMIASHLNNGGMAVVATHQEIKLSPSSFQRLELL